MKSFRELFWWGIFALIALIALAAAGRHAAAQMQMQCAPREAVASLLKSQAKEVEIIAITDRGWLLEVWKDEDGLWSAFLVDPKDPGYLCYVFGGGEWAAVEKPSF